MNANNHLGHWLNDRIEKSVREQTLIRIARHELEPDDTFSFGYAVASSDNLLVLHAVSSRIDLDGYEVVRLADITELKTRFSKKDFYEKALKLKSQKPLPPVQVDLADMATLLHSLGQTYPLVAFYREFVDPEICEVGKISFASADFVTLKWMSPTARWENGVRRFKTSDITRVLFGCEYERTLALVAGLVH